MLEASIEHTAQTLLQALKTHETHLVTAESCTGGLLASYLTSMAGSSSLFERGFITYSNNAKQDLLDVQAQTLSDHGAVSPATAKEMAKGALGNSRSDMAISITGIAGPGGGSDSKPVGLVYFGLCSQNMSPVSQEQHFEGTRETVRLQSVLAAFKMLMRYLESAE